MAALDDQIRAVLAADNPQSVRHVFYRLTDPTGPVSVPKTERGYDAWTLPMCGRMAGEVSGRRVNGDPTRPTFVG